MVPDCVQFPEVTPAPSPHCHDDTVLTQTGGPGPSFLKINSGIVFENTAAIKTRARLLNRSLQVAGLTPLLAHNARHRNKKSRQNRLSCQKAVSSLSGDAGYFSRLCPISWPGPGHRWPIITNQGEGDYLRRVKTENGLSDCQLRVSSPSRSRICCCHLKQFYFLETLNTVNTNLEPASVATLAFLTQVVFEYGNCQELPGLEPIHFCGSAHAAHSNN